MHPALPSQPSSSSPSSPTPLPPLSPAPPPPFSPAPLPPFSPTPPPPFSPAPPPPLSPAPLPPFPPAFLFGVATSDHQCEAYVPEYEDIRDVWERQRSLTPRGQATDFWNRYPEDIRLAAELGCKLFRLSLAWSRIEPSPGQFNPAAIDHYRQVIRTIRAAGMEPLVTLHHFTWPVHVEAAGGLPAEDFPRLFARYATYVAEHLGQEATYWVTFNEPTMLLFGFLKPWWEAHYFMPPGLPDHMGLDDQLRAVARVIRNLFVAHTQARASLKQANPHAQVGANPLLLGFPDWLQRLLDGNATRIRTEAQFIAQTRRLAERPLSDHGALDVVMGSRWLDPLLQRFSILSTALTSNWWSLGMAGRLAEFLCPSECVGQHDFVGFDYYWGISSLRIDRIKQLMGAAAGRYATAPVWPGALYGMLTYHQRLFPSLPILIVENGCVEVADGVTRAMYLQDHLAEVERAIKDGVNVMGYVCWAITSNREWGLPFGPASDFGLYHIQLDHDPTLTRQPTAAAEMYRSIIRGSGLYINSPV